MNTGQQNIHYLYICTLETGSELIRNRERVAIICATVLFEVTISIDTIRIRSRLSLDATVTSFLEATNGRVACQLERQETRDAGRLTNRAHRAPMRRLFHHLTQITAWNVIVVVVVINGGRALA